MSLSRKFGFWLGALVLFLAFVFVLRDVLMPFVAGLILAYLLDPLADRLERWKLGRLGATLLILVIFVSLFVAILVLAAPLFATQVTAFIERAPSYILRLQTLLAEQGGPLLERIGGEKVMQEIQQSLGDIAKQSLSWVGRVLASAWASGQAIASILSLLVITPVVTFYLLLDWDRIVQKVDSWVPVAQQQTVRRLAREIDDAVSGFIRGQTLVCLILGAVYAAGLMAIGLNFGALIGFSAGLLSFIPYVGSMLGLIVALAVAVAQFWPSWSMIGLVALVFVIGQAIEGNVLSPKLVGEKVGLHPVWLMFALLAGGSLFGFLGLLLSVPVAAAIGVLARFGIGEYLRSPLYTGVMAKPKKKAATADV
jgi:predicted PurR-regulated permease PerM